MFTTSLIIRSVNQIKPLQPDPAFPLEETIAGINLSRYSRWLKAQRHCYEMGWGDFWRWTCLLSGFGLPHMWDRLHRGGSRRLQVKPECAILNFSISWEFVLLKMLDNKSCENLYLQSSKVLKRTCEYREIVEQW